MNYFDDTMFLVRCDRCNIPCWIKHGTSHICVKCLDYLQKALDSNTINCLEYLAKTIKEKNMCDKKMTHLEAIKYICENPGQEVYVLNHEHISYKYNESSTGTSGHIDEYNCGQLQAMSVTSWLFCFKNKFRFTNVKSDKLLATLEKAICSKNTAEEVCKVLRETFELKEK